MGLNYDATASGYSLGVTSITFSHTCSGLNRLLVVWAHIEGPGSDTVTSVTFNAVNLTRLATKYLSNNAGSFWYLKDPAATTANIVVTSSTTVNTMNAVSASYTGIYRDGVPDSSNSYTAASGTSKTLSTTTVKDQSWLVMGLSHQDGTVAIDGANTTRRNVVSRTEIFDSNGGQTPPGSHSLAVTSISGIQMGVIASFAPFPSFGAIIL